MGTQQSSQIHTEKNSASGSKKDKGKAKVLVVAKRTKLQSIRGFCLSLSVNVGCHLK